MSPAAAVMEFARACAQRISVCEVLDAAGRRRRRSGVVLSVPSEPAGGCRWP